MKSTPAFTTTSRNRQLAREHAHIREAIEAVVSRLERTADHPEDRSALADLLEQVVSFREHLERHFWLEEAGGLLGDAVQYYAPEARRKAEELVTEHRDFERRIARINEQLYQALHDPLGLRRAPALDLSDLLRDLTDHERAETELSGRLLLGG